MCFRISCKINWPVSQSQESTKESTSWHHHRFSATIQPHVESDFSRLKCLSENALQKKYNSWLDCLVYHIRVDESMLIFSRKFMPFFWEYLDLYINVDSMIFTSVCSANPCRPGGSIFVLIFTVMINDWWRQMQVLQVIVTIPYHTSHNLTSQWNFQKEIIGRNSLSFHDAVPLILGW